MTREVRYHIGNGNAEMAPKHLTKQEFGRRLFSLMIEKGWNQSELARQAGLPRDSISTYIRGRSLPTPQSLKKLGEALGVNREALLPNVVESAIDEDNPSLDMRVSPGRPNVAWLRVNRQVSLATAMKVTQLLVDDELNEEKK